MIQKVNEHYIDVVSNLFTGKYTYDECMQVLAEIEFSGEAKEYIKTYQPQFYNFHWGAVNKFLLVEELIRVLKDK